MGVREGKEVGGRGLVAYLQAELEGVESWGQPLVLPLGCLLLLFGLVLGWGWAELLEWVGPLYGCVTVDFAVVKSCVVWISSVWKRNGSRLLRGRVASHREAACRLLTMSSLSLGEMST